LDGADPIDAAATGDADRGTDGAGAAEAGATEAGATEAGATLCDGICQNAWCTVPFAAPCPANDEACVSSCVEACVPAAAPCSPAELAQLSACVGRCDSLWPCIADVACMQ
jgi:hypothetical protein